MLPHDLSGGRSRLRPAWRRRQRRRRRQRARLQPVEEKRTGTRPVGRSVGKASLSKLHKISRRKTERGKNNREGEGERKKDDATEKCCRHSVTLLERPPARHATHSFAPLSPLHCSDCIPDSANQSGSVDKCAFREISCPIHPSADLVVQ